MTPEPQTKDGNGKLHRCSCGSVYALVNGEYHDCATERMVAHQERQTEALEDIASCLAAMVEMWPPEYRQAAIDAEREGR